MWVSCTSQFYAAVHLISSLVRVLAYNATHNSHFMYFYHRLRCGSITATTFTSGTFEFIVACCAQTSMLVHMRNNGVASQHNIVGASDTFVAHMGGRECGGPSAIGKALRAGT